MNAIIGMTVIGRSASDAERKEYSLQRIDAASKFLLGIINDILDMAKIEAGKLELDIQGFNLPAMFRGVADVVAVRAAEKKQTLELNLDAALPQFARGDNGRLSQVVTNLLANAIKFTPEGGKIGLEARVKDECDGIVELLVAVSDTGIGIAEEQKERLFKSFEQADSGISREYGGTGLGLAISKSIVELMGGEIRVESEVGRGSRFIFSCRLAAADGADVHASEGGADLESLRGKRVLLVEDVDINREIALTLLEDTGLEIDCAVDGLDAVNHIEEHVNGYDLILMDIHMPVMDGDEATRKIRWLNIGNSATVPIIAMTADVFREDIEHCLAAGMTDHIGKPIDIDVLLQKLKLYLGDKNE
ncbi:hypothetical protein FACS1894202_02790 [Clostridia bacterium]|nr:hypothetical protein FACS1894202_02790 [Clostridia bacterium]